ncbi:potassium transporter Kup [Sphingomonas oryzagri]
MARGPASARTVSLTAGALGVVFGDIGTSPLYAFKVAIGAAGHVPSPEAIGGIISLIIWSLILVISVKYALLIMRAENEGEGGIVAMLAILGSRKAAWLTMVAIIGAALLYGDGAITPAISVLSALEGASVSAPHFEPYVEPTALAILVGLFAVQSRGAGTIGRIFGPVMLVWFLTIGTLGLVSLVRTPAILEAFSPLAAFRFVLHAPPMMSVGVLGAVFLAVTGGEAMYADMGQFGQGPIRNAWFALVLPALLLNYLGQGAALLREPAGVRNPFYVLAPHWAHYPLVILATAATIIASQAVISGVFSLTRQAMRLDLVPHLSFRHTSDADKGQIFVPTANVLLAFATLAAVLLFRSSDALAGAYGIAVSGLMAISTFLAGMIARQWRYPLAIVLFANGLFLVVDLTFFAANFVKVREGGWYPLFLSAVVVVVMSTWRRGLTLVERARSTLRDDEEAFSGRLSEGKITILDGTAAFLTSAETGIPLTLTHHLHHNRVLHRHTLLVSIVIDEKPRTTMDEVHIEDVQDNISRAVLHFGYMDDIDVPGRLEAAVQNSRLQCDDIQNASYYLGHETIIPDRHVKGMAHWREALFVGLQRITTPTAASFGIPTSRAIDIGIELKI